MGLREIIAATLGLPADPRSFDPFGALGPQAALARTRPGGGGTVTLGFLSGLLTVGRTLLGAFTGAAAPVARAIAPAIQRLPTFVRRGGALLAGGAAFGAGDVGIQALLAQGSGVQIPGVEGQPSPAGGGNGRTVRQTIVVTRDTMTGNIIRTEVKQGAPLLMGRDVQIANRVFRQSQRLQKRLPKKIIKQSRRAALTNLVVEGALERAACPPTREKC